MLHARVTATTLSCVGTNIASDLSVQGQQPLAPRTLCPPPLLPPAHAPPAAHQPCCYKPSFTQHGSVHRRIPVSQEATSNRVHTLCWPKFLLKKTLTLSCPTLTEMSATADRSGRGGDTWPVASEACDIMWLAPPRQPQQIQSIHSRLVSG